jgi:uncharacterized protein YprB with RNaseH-like and TPR domain
VEPERASDPQQDKRELLSSLRRKIRYLTLKTRAEYPSLHRADDSAFPVAEMREKEIATPHGAFLLLDIALASGWPKTKKVVTRYGKFCEDTIADRYGFGWFPAACPPENLLYLDIETAGLSSSIAFLVGLMYFQNNDLVIRQYFARDYSEEQAMLYELNRFLPPFDLLVTFNGKSFDVPFLRDRMALHGLVLEEPAEHLDLLHQARRLWRGKTPNCRLTTLERLICGRTRVGDVPGREIPGLYHDYVKSKSENLLSPVFHHNRLDLLTMAELVMKIFEPRDHA